MEAIDHAANQRLAAWRHRANARSRRNGKRMGVLAALLALAVIGRLSWVLLGGS